MAAKSIYEGPIRTNSLGIKGTPTITFGDIGTFETGRDQTVAFPAVNLAGANNGDPNTSGMIWRSVRTVSIQNLAINNASKNTLQTSPGSPFPYRSRVAVNGAGDLGAVGTPLAFDSGTLRMNNGFQTYLGAASSDYSISGLNAKHPVTSLSTRISVLIIQSVAPPSSWTL